MTRRWYTCAHAGTSAVRCSELVSPASPFNACPVDRSNQDKPLTLQGLNPHPLGLDPQILPTKPCQPNRYDAAISLLREKRGSKLAKYVHWTHDWGAI